MASVDCCTPAPPAVHLDGGKDGSIGDLKAYLNKPPSATAAIIFMSDIMGSHAPLLRKLADKAAAAGYYAVVPDFFRGDPYVFTDPDNVLADLAPWIAKHQPSASMEDTRIIIKELKDEGIKSIGCSGFCWGAGLAVPMLKLNPNVDAIVILHPSLVTPQDLKGRVNEQGVEEYFEEVGSRPASALGITATSIVANGGATCSAVGVEKPIAILGAEFDKLAPPEMVEQMRVVLAAKPEVPSFVKLYRGQSHGWSIRYDINDKFEVEGAMEAQHDMFEFYKKVL